MRYMNGNEIVNILQEGLPAPKSIFETVASAIITAIFLRFNTKTVEFEKMKMGQVNLVVDSLLKSGDMSLTEYYKAKNFLEIAKKADEYNIKNRNKNKKEEKIDFDWLIRFYEVVGNISNEEMQNLWAKILADEISKPTSFSLKTLDVLRNISSKDAKLFEKLYSHSFKMTPQRPFLPNIKCYLEDRDISYTDIMKLNELGLISSDTHISLIVDVDSSQQPIFKNGNYAMTIVSSSGKKRTIEIPQFIFTEAGEQISSVIEQSTEDSDFKEFGELLNERSDGFCVKIHKIIRSDDNSILLETSDILSTI